MAQNHALSYVSCWVSWSINLICLCESSCNEDAKVGIGFVCSSNTPRKNQQKCFKNSLRFIDGNRTVGQIYLSMIECPKHDQHVVLCHKWLCYRRATAEKFVLNVLYWKEPYFRNNKYNFRFYLIWSPCPYFRFCSTLIGLNNLMASSWPPSHGEAENDS